MASCWACRLKSGTSLNGSVILLLYNIDTYLISTVHKFYFQFLILVFNKIRLNAYCECEILFMCGNNSEYMNFFNNPR